MAGMIDKDKQFAPEGQLSEWVNDGSEFVRYEIETKGTIDTPDGPSDSTPMVWLTVATLDAPDSKDVVSMVGDYAFRKAQERQEALAEGNNELPAVVKTQHVSSSIEGGHDAYVFTFVREFDGIAVPRED